MDQSGDHTKKNFDYFQIQKWRLQTVRAEKVDEKWGHLSSFHVSFLDYDVQIVQEIAFFIILRLPQQEI